MKIDKIIKKLTPTLVNEMDAVGPDDLKQLIVTAEESIETAAEELDANPKYQAAKEAAKDLSSAYRDTKSYQRAKIAYALHLLREKGSSNA